MCLILVIASFAVFHTTRRPKNTCAKVKRSSTFKKCMFLEFFIIQLPCVLHLLTQQNMLCKRPQKVFLKSTALLFFLMNMTQHYKNIMIKQKKTSLELTSFDSAFDFKHKTHSVWTTLYRSKSVCLVLQVIERMENGHKLNSDCYINKVTRNLNFYYMQWNIYR